MIQLFTAVTILLALHIDFSVATCGRPPVIWRNDNITCPSRAVCADKFHLLRDWRNGTTCEEERVMSNCICPGNRVCPFNDDAHKLHSSISHEMYFCQPVCNRPWCPNVPLDRAPRVNSRISRYPSRRRDNSPVAFTFVQNAPEFLDRSYYRLDCRCPRHHFPVTTGPRRRQRAVVFKNTIVFHAQSLYTTQYVCNTSPSDGVHEDPCPARTHSNL